MASKDWKKTREWVAGVIHWTNKKGIRIYIGKPTNLKGKYGVEVADISGRYNEIIYKRFTTKTKAVAFAKAYMRKH